MNSMILTVNTAAGPALIGTDLVSNVRRDIIEYCSDVIIRTEKSYRKAITKMIKLFVRIGYRCVPYYFGLVPNPPP